MNTRSGGEDSKSVNILFWNTYQNPLINPYLASLVKDNDINILVLAEYVASHDEFKRLLLNTNHRLEEYVTDGCKRITIFGDYSYVVPADQVRYYSIQIVNDDFILCGVHLPSNLHADNSKRDKIIRDIMQDIHNREKGLSTLKTVIVGDMNEMPYDYGCMASDTFYGLSFHEENSKRYRTIAETDYPKYYNPMWNFFGDFDYPPGTYYYEDSESMIEPGWLMFDQFILGRELAGSVSKDDVRIITGCSYGGLADEKGHPDKDHVSDHFPIFCRIRRL